MNTAVNEPEFYAHRALVLAQLLLETETTLAAAVGTPPDQISIERIQDAAILAIRDAAQNLTHIDIHIVDDEHGA